MSDALAVALAASRPIADPPRQPLPVEMLISDHERRPMGKDRLAYENQRADADLTELLTEIQTVERNHCE